MLESPIQANNPRGELIWMAGVMMSDEAPMLNKAALACVDDTCRQVMQVDQLFGGKFFILSGGFCWTCPIIRKGSIAEVINASIHSWPFWNQIKIYHLTIPHCNVQDSEFQRWVDSIGDGAAPEISLVMLRCVEKLGDIWLSYILWTSWQTLCVVWNIPSWPLPTVKLMSTTTLFWTEFMVHNAPIWLLIASKKLLPRVWYPQTVFWTMPVNKPRQVYHHILQVKVNGIYCLIHNFSVDRGLVKNARVIVSEMGNRLITVRLIHQHSVYRQRRYPHSQNFVHIRTSIRTYPPGSSISTDPRLRNNIQQLPRTKPRLRWCQPHLPGLLWWTTVHRPLSGSHSQSNVRCSTSVSRWDVHSQCNLPWNITVLIVLFSNTWNVISTLQCYCTFLCISIHIILPAGAKRGMSCVYYHDISTQNSIVEAVPASSSTSGIKVFGILQAECVVIKIVLMSHIESHWFHWTQILGAGKHTLSNLCPISEFYISLRLSTHNLACF